MCLRVLARNGCLSTCARLDRRTQCPLRVDQSPKINRVRDETVVGGARECKKTGVKYLYIWRGVYANVCFTNKPRTRVGWRTACARDGNSNNPCNVCARARQSHQQTYETRARVVWSRIGGGGWWSDISILLINENVSRKRVSQVEQRAIVSQQNGRAATRCGGIFPRRRRYPFRTKTTAVAYFRWPLLFDRRPVACC